MQPKAIVYSSNTGHTAQYAQLLAERSKLPCYTLEEAKQKLSPNEPIIYLGWLIAGFVKGLKSAKKAFDLQGVCAVGLGDSGAQVYSVRKTNKIDGSVKVYTLQGGIDRDRLTGLYASMINTLEKVLKGKKNPSADELAMIELLNKNNNYVCVENLSEVFADFGWN